MREEEVGEWVGEGVGVCEVGDWVSEGVGDCVGEWGRLCCE